MRTALPRLPLPVELVLHARPAIHDGHGHVDVGTVDHLVAAARLVEQVEQLPGADPRLAGEGLDGLGGRHERGRRVGCAAERVATRPAMRSRSAVGRSAAAVGADGRGRVDGNTMAARSGSTGSRSAGRRTRWVMIRSSSSSSGPMSRMSSG